MEEAVSAPTPALARLVVGLDRNIGRASHLTQGALRVMMCTVLPASRRQAMTVWCYDRRADYLPGGKLNQHGLFPWELEALETSPFPPAGRILLGGAGGGRELVGLSALGYQVVAFEPSKLVAGARRAANEVTGPPAEVVCASYDDLAQGRGPLLATFDEGFAGIVLGWGSLSHVLSAQHRRDLFATLRRLAPEAPVLCSFEGGRPSAHPRVQAIADRIGGQPGLRFNPSIGFHHLFDPGEIEGLAAASGYTVASTDYRNYPWTILTPDATAAVSTGPTHHGHAVG